MPKSYYTLIKIAPNHISGDKLSIGLIVFDEKNIKIKFSAERQNIARRLINNGSDTIAYVSHQIEQNLKNDAQKLREKVVVKSNEGQWVTNYLDYLQRYSNGTLQFSEPHLITEELTDQNFEKLFQSLFETTTSNVVKLLPSDYSSPANSDKNSSNEASLNVFSLTHLPNKEFAESVSGKPFLEQLYLSLKRVEDIPCLPSYFLLRLYPFNHISETVTTYISAFTLVTNHFELLDFFENIEIIDEEKIHYKKSNDLKDIEGYQEKLEFIIRKLNAFLVFEIQGRGGDTYKNVYLKRKRLFNSINLFFDFKFAEASDLLSYENPKDIHEALRNAYTHYQFGNHITAYQLYRDLALVFENTKNYFYYFLCLYNIKNLANHIHHAHSSVDWEETQAIVKEIDKINLNQKLKELQLLPEIEEAILLIKDNWSFLRSFYKITTLSRQIIDNYHLDQSGGFSSNHHLLLLRSELTNMVEFMTNNSITFDRFRDFKDAIEITTEAFIASHAIGKNINANEESIRQSSYLAYFDDYLLIIMAVYVSPDNWKKYLKKYQITELKYQSKDKFFFKLIENFFDVQNESNYILPKLREEKNLSFYSKYNTIFKNILILLANINLDKQELLIFLKQIIYTTERNFIFLDSFNYDFLNYFLRRKKDVLADEIFSDLLFDYLKSYVLRSSGGLFYSRHLVKTLSEILIEYHSQVKIKDLETIHSIIKVYQTNKSDLNYFYPIIAKKHQAYFQETIYKILENNFEKDLYIQAVKNGIIHYQPFFHQFLTTAQDQEIIDLAYHLNLDLSTKPFQKIAEKSAYYNWLVNLETFDYSQFKIEWLTRVYSDNYFKKFREIPAIKDLLTQYLKKDRNQQLEDIYFDYFA